MKIYVDNELVLEISDIKKKVLKDDIQDEIFDSDMKRRVHYILTHKYEWCLERLKKEWLPKLKERGVASIPLNDDAFAELVFSQPDYRSRSHREAEGRAAEQATFKVE